MISFTSMSQITTHILDTTIGKPAHQVLPLFYITAKMMNGKKLQEAKQILTEELQNLLNENVILQQGIYKMRFETKDYFDMHKVETFYPYVEIIFEITSKEHYHIPLLINPFGYSTYRGS